MRRAVELIVVPLIALMSLNQVLLGKMSGAQGHDRLRWLERGLVISTVLTLPPAAALIAAAPALVALLLPNGLVNGPLPQLLALYALGIVFGSWNALLARYYYADGDTRTPLALELAGSAAQAALLFALPLWLGLPGLAFAGLGGVLLTGVLLTGKLGHGLQLRLMRQGAVAALVALTCGWLLFPLFHRGLWLQLGLATVAGVIVLLGLWWRWRYGERPARSQGEA